MIIAFDLDGVVVDSPQQVVNYINERLCLGLTMDDFTTYSMEDALPEHYRWIVSEAFLNPKMWKNVGLIDGAYNVIKKLYSEGYDIYFATSSLPANLDKKIKHLTRNLDFFPPNYVWQHTINIHHKQLLDVDILVDDALHNLAGERDYFSICLNMPYNQTGLNIPNFARAKDWQEVYDKIHMVDKLIKESNEWED